jgi:hypothetical protein
MTKVHIEGSALGFNVVIQCQCDHRLPSYRALHVQGDDELVDGRRLRHEASELMLGLVLAHDFVAGALAVYKL